MLRQVSGTIGDIQVDRLTVIGNGGEGDDGDLATTLIKANEQIKAAVGVDVPEDADGPFRQRFTPRRDHHRLTFAIAHTVPPSDWVSRPQV